MRKRAKIKTKQGFITVESTFSEPFIGLLSRQKSMVLKAFTTRWKRAANVREKVEIEEILFANIPANLLCAYYVQRRLAK